MKLRTTVGISLICVAMLTGCATSLPSVLMKSNEPPGMPLDATAVFYTNTFFQARFMGVRPLVLGPALGYAFENFEGRKGQRLQSGDFEKLLDEFDVFEYFNEELKKRAGDCRTVKLKFASSPELASQVVELARCDYKDACMAAVKSLNEPISHIAAFKMSYGLGARQGSEQIGFRKYYRPFIRVLGVVKKVPSGEAIWQSDILVFGDKRYLGDDADADRIPRDELVFFFKVLTAQAIDLLVGSLNGEMLQEMPILADTVASDLKF
jgi:hypothetical protein